MSRPSERREEETAILKALGTRVAAIRGSRRMSQRELSASSGIDITTISRIEGGVNSPSLITIMAIARSLGTSLDFLAYGQPDGVFETTVEHSLHPDGNPNTRTHHSAGFEVRLDEFRQRLDQLEAEYKRKA